MGYYMPGPTFGKAEHIIAKHDGRMVDEAEASRLIDDPTVGIVCVKTNWNFDAAGFCYDRHEFEAFAHADGRPTTFIAIDRAVAEAETEYRKPAPAAC